MKYVTKIKKQKGGYPLPETKTPVLVCFPHGTDTHTHTHTHTTLRLHCVLESCNFSSNRTVTALV